MTASAIGRAVRLEVLESDPYPIYRRLRDEEPVSWIDAVGLWFATRWDDVRAIADDSATFSADTEPSMLNRTIGKSLMRSDGLYHRAVRSVIEPPFHVRAVRDRLNEIVARHVAELIDSLPDSGETDLVSSFTEPLSIRVLRDVLGLRDVEEQRLRTWFDGFATGGANFEGDSKKQAYADRASADADSVLLTLFERLDKKPDDSVISAMLRGRVDGRALTHAEVLSNVKLMILGGMQEPRDLIGLTLIALLEDHSRIVESVRSDKSVLRVAVEEALRCFSPVGTLTRQTTRSVKVAGVELPKDAMVAAVIASANRDERRFPDPDRFDLTRGPRAHLAFGIGPHFCIGAALARHEATVALTALLDLPGLRLDPKGPPVVRGWEFRGPTNLHAVWRK